MSTTMPEALRVLVYRDKLLPLSETFVANQSLFLQRYQAYFLGSRRNQPSIPLPEERLRVINEEGKKTPLRKSFWDEVLFKVFGRLPREVAQWVKAVRPLLVHAHFAPDGALALPLARLLGVPLVVSLLGTDITMREREVWLRSWPSHRLYLLRKRQLQREAKLFIVPSRFLLEKALERGYPREKLVVLPHGVDVGFFHPDPAAVEYARVLYVGRLIELKGLRYLMGALAPLVSLVPSLRLVVIGDGPMRKEYEALGRQLLGDRVCFLGAQPKEVVRREMQRAYIFSMPSVTMPSGETETFGMVYLEAQACGVPVVAFRSGGVSEVISHEKTGFLVQEKDVEALSYAIRQLLENPALHQSMSRVARKWVESHFALSLSNEQLESLYDRLVRRQE